VESVVQVLGGAGRLEVGRVVTGARFDGRVALVTGAAGDGIGQATARRLLEEGARVAVTDNHARRTLAVAAELADKYGDDSVCGVVLDVSDRGSIDAGLAEAQAKLGTVDIVVNNAAINVLTEVADMDPADWDYTMAVDLSGPWYLTRALLPGMYELGRGSIVTITSVAGYLGGGREGPYAAAKAALHSLTRTPALEGGPRGVRANAVAPGIIESKFIAKHRDNFVAEIEKTPLRRLGLPEDVASVVAFLVSDDAAVVTGETITVSGGWYMRP
jgi:NAD(P)-dependent dehydrogenase (short-subunit alcohol dehydrogenase family)